eukprot:COSAG06_NODE_4031_length_4641_cov_24.869661_3_plen_265_part_00
MAQKSGVFLPFLHPTVDVELMSLRFISGNCKKTHLFLSFPYMTICLSRACLGKMPSFWVSNGIAKEMRFYAFFVPHAVRRSGSSAKPGERKFIRNAGLFLSFPYVCPERVLVKISFLYKNGSKRPRSLTWLSEQLVHGQVQRPRVLRLGVRRWRRLAPPAMVACRHGAVARARRGNTTRLSVRRGGVKSTREHPALIGRLLALRSVKVPGIKHSSKSSGNKKEARRVAHRRAVEVAPKLVAIDCKKAALVFSFVYVCPEPVLVK